MPLPQKYGHDWNKEAKSFQNLCGGREKVLEKFSKDGSRWPCMHASFGTENKSWRVTSACMNEKQNQNTSVVTWRRKETKGE
jgi:hypothetical protein